MLSERPLVGFHASISHGLHKALEQAGILKCPTVQLFTKNNRSWKEPVITNTTIDEFNTTRTKENIKVIISHASYLINLASARPSVRHSSLYALKQELSRSSSLGIEYVVLHPGSHTTLSLTQGIDYLIEGCNQALENTKAMLLLETMAGQGSSIGKQFEELALIIEKIERKEKIGICLDTCHIFAAGYTTTTAQDYNTIMQTFDTICGLNYLKVIHVNDSKKKCGSKVDRHEHIGEGKIGLTFFTHLMNDPKLKLIPKILETPKKSLEDDAVNIRRLISLIKK